MAHRMSVVGLDVHASQTHAAVLDTATGELRGVRLRMPPTGVVEFLVGLPSPNNPRALTPLDTARAFMDDKRTSISAGT